METGNFHFVMFPWLAIGHLIPFLHLSRSLAERGHRVSFISTPKNLQRLPQIPSDFSYLIDLVSIPLPSVENLPDNAESSMDIPHKKAQFLKIAFDLLQLPITSFLEKTSPKPDWIIYDYASHWMPQLASKFGIPTSFFSLFNAANLAFIGPPSIILSGEVVRSKAEDFAVVPKWFPFSSTIAYRVHEVLKYVDGSAGNNESGTDDTTRFGVSVDACDIVLVRTSIDFEPEYFNLLSELYKKPTLSLGFLPPPVDDSVTNDDSTWTEIRDWLDNKKERSVVYVALGTEATLDQKEMEQLALGLEQCGVPFFWVVRKPPGSTEDVSEMILKGFAESTGKNGVIYKGWVPQVKILSHPAIGGFLTH
ncbi:glycosyltransferase [Lithospermum erythrorhizon]|uniref:Glycosyltransferase n=1 Tax=Lithospermum erythrorhizon TaxID=34254 RepID=A0AAV3NHH0_LITER